MSTITTSDPAYQEVIAYMVCVYKGEGQNPDMQGFAVRLSNFIANVCLAILIRYSDEDVAESVAVVLLQVYTILVGTFISMARKQLSLADAHFALTSTISPLSVYLVYASFRKAINKRSYLFRRLGERSTKMYTTLPLLLVVLWVVLDLLIYFANLFTESCHHITLIGWIMYRYAASLVTFIYASILIVFIVIVWFVYLLRHFKDIRMEYRRHKAKAVRWKHFRWVQWFPLWLKSFTVSQWDVITQSHPWLLGFTVFTLYVIWFSALTLWALDIGRFYHDLIESVEGSDYPAYTPPAGYDALGFGQLLAAAVAFPPLWQVLTMSWGRRADLWGWVKGYPGSLWNGTVFILTGHRNPWKQVLANRTEDGKDSLYDTIPLNGQGVDEEEIKMDYGAALDLSASNQPAVVSLPSGWRPHRSSTESPHHFTPFHSTTTLYDPAPGLPAKSS